MTYRLGGHSFGSTTEYMDPDELSAAEADEPLGRNRAWLGRERGIDEEVLAQMEAEVRQQVEAALESAKASAPPSADELLTDVFSTMEASPR
jgi:TPP-dependent pyruvate/acetoin dehydrogenase alpha subunit